MRDVLDVESAAGLVTVQDDGRPGLAHEGTPRAGALVPAWLHAANALAGNGEGEAAVEIVGRLVVRARERLRVATERGAAELAAGERLEVAPARGARVTYLAVQGGVAVPVVRGSRATLLVAGLGGLGGRVLRRGDALPAGEARAAGPAAAPADVAHDLARAIGVVPGPDEDSFAADAIDVLLASTFVVAPESDRVGVRLAGPPLPRRVDGADETRPMVPGALEVPAAGRPIVLGPDGPTTGGYPIIAVVASADLGALLARAPGERVRFVRAA